MLKITEITDKKIWEDFLSDTAVGYYPFFQSWNFGKVQERFGALVKRVGVWRGNQLVAICQIIDVNARRGHYLHLRHGPVLKPFNKEIFDFLMTYIKKLAQEKNAYFIRLNPVVEKQHVPVEFIRSRHMKDSPIHKMDGEVAWVLDIRVPEEELLKNMRKSHRYLIKKARENKDLTITTTSNFKDIEKFLPLYKSLSQRKHFVPHKGVRFEFEIFGKDNQEVLYLAKYKNKIIAGALIAFVGHMAIYRHSASDDTHRDVPAMYLLLWEAILESKKRGLKIFNFWGVITDLDSKRHPWHGLSLFKKGFGGELKEFLHAQDISISILYWKTYIIELSSKILKGY